MRMARTATGPRVKPTTLTLRPEVKAAAAKLAFQSGKSLSAWVESLIERSLRRSGVSVT
jgi:predicted HicB family RNase H-like nuclease